MMMLEILILSGHCFTPEVYAGTLDPQTIILLSLLQSLRNISMQTEYLGNLILTKMRLLYAM